MNDVHDFYNGLGKKYEDKIYTSNLSKANDRLEIINNIISKYENINTVLDLGCGAGTPIQFLTNKGYRVDGVDFSENMVNSAKALNPESTIVQGDITNLDTFKNEIKDDYDAIISFGTLMYIDDTKKAIENMKKLIKKDGKLVINFRNKLFSLTTFNKFTYEFIVEDILSNVSDDIKSKVSSDIKNYLNMNEPSVEVNIGGPSAKFHVPFEIEELMEEIGFKDINIHFYHHHAGPPMFFKDGQKEQYEDESNKLELGKRSWRSMFLSSAFIIEATV